MAENRKHRILLINFSDQDAATVARAGFNVEQGYIGKPQGLPNKHRVPYSISHPVYDYDVYAYSSLIPEGKDPALQPRWSNLLDRSGITEPLARFSGPPWIRISFIGECIGPSSLLMGVPFLCTVPADPGVSEVAAIPSSHSERLPDLRQSITRLKKSISFPVGQFVQLTTKPDDMYPYNDDPVLVSRNGNVIATYGSFVNREDSYKDEPVYVVLPQLKTNALALVELLKLLARLRPQVFIGMRAHDWLKGNEFAFPEEQEIEKETKKKIEETNQFIQKKRSEKSVVEKRHGFIRRILIATEEGSREDRLRR
ncbi:MAG: hypothetical protein IH789_09540 [Acidobacteria bacterium]|nr:hypothetical protein [Acidobacteriota bacterium]